MIDRARLETLTYPRIVYRGGSPTFHYGGYRFYRDVPVWFPRWAIPELPVDFALYTGEEPDVRHGPPILVRMPAGLPEFIAAETALERLKVAFPTCELHLLAPPALAEIADDYRVFTAIASSARAPYYRIFELRTNSLALTYRSPHKLKWPWHAICLMALGLYDAQLDGGQDQIVSLVNRDPDPEPYIAVCRDGVTVRSTQQGSDGIVTALRERYDVRGCYAHQGDTTRKDVAKDGVGLAAQVEQIRRAAAYIGFGESPWNTVAAYAGVPSLMFLPASRRTDPASAANDTAVLIPWRQQAAAEWVSVVDILPADDVGLNAHAAVVEWVGEHGRGLARQVPS